MKPIRWTLSDLLTRTRPLLRKDIADLPPQALTLARAFWPGALTLVVPLRTDAGIAGLVTAGLDTIGIRVPAHPVAQALLVFRQGERLLFGLPVGKQQPVGHVLAALGRQVDLRQRAVVPTQRAQHGGDQLGLGLRFVEGRVGVAPAEHRVQAGAEAGHRLIGEGLPGGRFAHAAQQKVL